MGLDGLGNDFGARVCAMYKWFSECALLQGRVPHDRGARVIGGVRLSKPFEVEVHYACEHREEVEREFDIVL